MSVIDPTVQRTEKVPCIPQRPQHQPRWQTQEITCDATGEPVPILLSTDGRIPTFQPGDRVHDLFERRCIQLEVLGEADHPALDFGDVVFSFADLSERVNRLARFLQAQGVRADDRVAILLDRSIHSHSMVLALSQLSATWVPLDVGFPDDRIQYIIEDSESILVVTLDKWLDRLTEIDLPIISIDKRVEDIESMPPTTLRVSKRPDDPISYIIYTSGTTGRPKGVPIRQSSIYNFIQVAADIYGYQKGDRVYQGMTIAFDFSVEELWVPLIAGATIVPAPSDLKMVGATLDDFLVDNQINALCCVPTLLATLDPSRIDLRFLLVSGEACPPDVIDPWLGKTERIVNAYGPTEATVTATWSIMESEAPVTIGGPLPTYSVIMLDPEEPKVLGPGEEGEICLGGIAVADGYLNRPDKTAAAFIPDFVGLPDNPGGQIYRTGDLGLINEQNQIEYRGRIDTQVKIRGYRIELEEIDAVARTVPGVGQVVVDAWQPEEGGKQLVLYYTNEEPSKPVDTNDIAEALREHLPAYMVPSYCELLDELPLLPSTKVNRHALPEPSGSRFGASGDHVDAGNTVEKTLADTLTVVLGTDKISVDADLFEEVGVDSLVVARWLTALSEDSSIGTVTAKMVYDSRKISTLATTLGVSEADKIEKEDEPVYSIPVHRPKETHHARRVPHLLTAVAQVVFLGLFAAAFVISAVYALDWIDAASDNWTKYQRLVASSLGLLYGTSAVLVALKWLSIGRFNRKPIKLWSFKYFRFWVARTSIQANPMNLFAGSPIYNYYLRTLGASVGKRSVLLGKPPICTDLFSVGHDSVIRDEVNAQCFTVDRGWVIPGPVRIGSNALVDDACNLGIYTSVGFQAQLGATSGVPEGHVVADGQRHQGSPPEPCTEDYDRVAKQRTTEGTEATYWRRTTFSVIQFLVTALVTSPLIFLAAILAIRALLDLQKVSVFPGGIYGRIGDVLLLTTGFVLAATLSTLLSALTIPRFLNLFVRPEKVQPLYGVQWTLSVAIARFSNIKFLNELFGDSALILHYLKWLGYDLSETTQTGSNFGMSQRHQSPFHSRFRKNTMISDGLFLANREVSTTGFFVTSIEVPEDTFIGNNVHYPAQARLGPNCIIATKAAIPTEGALRSNTGLLGSPSFEIPRNVNPDEDLDKYKDPAVLKPRLKLKLRANLLSMLLYLFRFWLITLLGLTAFYISFFLLGGRESTLASALALCGLTLVLMFGSPFVSVFTERLAHGFKRLKPLTCSLYDKRFWHHERLWKMSSTFTVFDGTPVKPVLRRLQGAQYGKMVFDDSTGIPEASLTQVGDYCSLNFDGVLQGHSLEDGAFKSDWIRVGDDCTVGVGAFVHYGTTIEDNSEIEVDSFVMKGSTIPADSAWHGNPAAPTGRKR